MSTLVNEAEGMVLQTLTNLSRIKKNEIFLDYSKIGLNRKINFTEYV